VKTQLIYLDPHDDHASARDKLAWARADRIVLIWPPHGRILTRPLDLTLLLRAARAQGGQLGLVTHDPDVRACATELGIPVFDIPDRLPDSAWQVPQLNSFTPPVKAFLPRPLRAPPGRESRALPVQGWRRIFLALLPLLALLALAVTIVPAAVVELHPLTTEQNASFELVLTPDSRVIASSSSIPARRWTQTLDGDLRQTTTGSALVPSARASGTVLVRNLTSEDQVVPAGTGLRTADGVRFLTLSEAALAAGVDGQNTVDVEAVEPGELGNVPAGAISAMEGSLGLLVTVANPQATEGGASAPRPGVSSRDLERLTEALTRQLLQEARSSVEAGLAAGERIAPESLRAVRVISSEAEPAVGQPGDSLRLRMRLEVEAVLYQDADLQAYAETVLAESGGEAFATVPGSPQAELGSLVEEGTEGMVYAAHAYRRLYRAVEDDELRRLLLGRPPSEAAQRLERRIDLARPPLILLWPSWLPRLPLLPVRIDIHWAWGSE
jgi:hypothetical protein